MKRQPAGVPVGGQFAASARPESGAHLARSHAQSLVDEAFAYEESDRGGVPIQTPSYAGNLITVETLADSGFKDFGAPSEGEPIARIFTQGRESRPGVDAAVYADASGKIWAIRRQAISKDLLEGPEEYVETSESSYNEGTPLRDIVDDVAAGDVVEFERNAQEWFDEQEGRPGQYEHPYENELRRDYEDNQGIMR